MFRRVRPGIVTTPIARTEGKNYSKKCTPRSCTVGDMTRTVGNMTRTVGDMTRTVGDMTRTVGNMTRTVGNMTRTVGDMTRTFVDYLSLRSWLCDNKPLAFAKVAGRPCALAVQCVLYRDCSHILYCVRVFKVECSHWTYSCRRFV